MYPGISWIYATSAIKWPLISHIAARVGETCRCESSVKPYMICENKNRLSSIHVLVESFLYNAEPHTRFRDKCKFVLIYGGFDICDYVSSSTLVSYTLLSTSSKQRNPVAVNNLLLVNCDVIKHGFHTIHIFHNTILVQNKIRKSCSHRMRGYICEFKDLSALCSVILRRFIMQDGCTSTFLIYEYACVHTQYKPIIF